MAEPSEFFSKKMVSVFLDEYNRRNGTNFRWLKSKSYQPKDKPYLDFVLFDGDRELGIQHTRATSDPSREFIRPKAADNVIEPLRKILQENSKLPSLSIYINFHNPPNSKEEVSDAIYWLEYFISSKVTTSFGLCYFNHDASFDDQFLPRLRKYIDHIDIKPYHGIVNGKTISFTYQWSKRDPEPWPDDAQRILGAVVNKAKTSKDTLLLIESGWSGVHDSYLNIIKSELQKIDLKEVWIVELFLGKERSYRIK